MAKELGVIDGEHKQNREGKTDILDGELKSLDAFTFTLPLDNYCKPDIFIPVKNNIKRAKAWIV